MIPLAKTMVEDLRRYWAFHRHPLLLFPNVGRGSNDRAQQVYRGVGVVQCRAEVNRTVQRFAGHGIAQMERHNYRVNCHDHCGHCLGGGLIGFHAKVCYQNQDGSVNEALGSVSIPVGELPTPPNPLSSNFPGNAVLF